MCSALSLNKLMSRVSSLVTQFVNFDPETLVFLGHLLSENDPSFELNNNFVYGQIYGRDVKF